MLFLHRHHSPKLNTHAKYCHDIKIIFRQTSVFVPMELKKLNIDGVCGSGGDGGGGGEWTQIKRSIV